MTGPPGGIFDWGSVRVEPARAADHPFVRELRRQLSTPAAEEETAQRLAALVRELLRDGREG